jgi:hypothetical protein
VTTTDDGAFALDLLLGEVEAEAARRRAAPGYPHELEAQIEAELARQAPSPSARLSLEHLVTAVEEASFVNIDVPVAASRREYAYAKRALKRAMAWYMRHVANQVSALGFATARTLRAVTARIEDVEQRLGDLERSEGADDALLMPDAPAAESYLEEWIGTLTEQMAGVAGRVLYADADSDAVVARLRAAGLDAYGLTRDAGKYQLSPDVRHADLIAHLDSVGDEALGAVLLAGCTDAINGAGLRAVIDGLDRCTQPGAVVAVVAEAPWWWRERQDPVEADMADARPLAAETWLAALHRAGFKATAAYGRGGRSYGLVARRETAEPDAAEPEAAKPEAATGSR